MSFSRPRYNRNNCIRDKQEKCLRSFLLPLISNNNVTRILAQREINGSGPANRQQRIIGVNYRSSYNFKPRRFIVSGKDCFTQMWKVADIVYTFLCDNGLIDHREMGINTIEKNTTLQSTPKPRKPSVNFIRRHCSLYNIKDQIHIIEKNQALDSEDIERINRCFMLIIIDYGDEFSRNIRGNTEYIQDRYGITVHNPRVNSLILEERNWRGQTEEIPFQETLIPEILKVYNSEKNEEVSVFHKNICYVSTQKVLYHNSWINISDYE